MPRWLGAVAILLLGLRIALSVLFPVFGDEAYYYYWGAHPAGGFYDLPPMIGWWLSPMVAVSSSPVWVRLPSFLASLAVAVGLFRLIRGDRGAHEARTAACLFFFLPLPFLALIPFPDLPLMVFSFFSAAVFFRGVRDQRRFFSASLAGAGLLWGCAFLSKYFAVFLLPAMLLWGWTRGRHRWGGIVSFALGAVPPVLQHLEWNHGHCWSNFVFNLVVRQKAFEGTVVQTTGMLILHCLLVAAPVLLAFLPFAKRPEKGGVSDQTKSADLERYLFLLWAVPLGIFALTALRGRGQGLHWLLFLIPFFAGWSVLRAGERRGLWSLRIAMAMSFLFSSALIGSMAFPREVLGGFFMQRNHSEFVAITSKGAMTASFAGHLAGTKAFFIDNYSLASFFHVEFRNHPDARSLPPVNSWMTGSRFGRAFDWTVRWAELEGQEISFFRYGHGGASDLAPYFDEIVANPMAFEDVNFTVFRGKGFRAREFWLARVKPELESFYPPFLPGKCPIQEPFDAI